MAENPETPTTPTTSSQLSGSETPKPPTPALGGFDECGRKTKRFAIRIGYAAHVDPSLLVGRSARHNLTQMQRRVALNEFVEVAAHRPSLFAYSLDSIEVHAARMSLRDASLLPALVKNREYVPAPREMHDFLDVCDSTDSTHRYILSRLRDAMPRMDVDVSTATWRKALVAGRQTLLRMFSVLPNVSYFKDLNSRANKDLMVPAWDAFLASTDQIRCGTVRIVADEATMPEYAAVFEAAREAGYVDKIATQILACFVFTVTEASHWFNTVPMSTRLDLLQLQHDAEENVIRGLEIRKARKADPEHAEAQLRIEEMKAKTTAYYRGMIHAYPSVPDDLRHAVRVTSTGNEVRALIGEFLDRCDTLSSVYDVAAERTLTLMEFLREPMSVPVPSIRPPETFAVRCTCGIVSNWTFGGDVDSTIRCACASCGIAMIFDCLPPAAMYCGDVNPDARGVVPDAFRKKTKVFDPTPTSPARAIACIACIAPPRLPRPAPAPAPHEPRVCGPHAIAACSAGCGAEFSKEAWKGVAGGIDWRATESMACFCAAGCDGRLVSVTVRGREVFRETEVLLAPAEPETEVLVAPVEPETEVLLAPAPALPDLMALVRLEPRDAASGPAKKYKTNKTKKPRKTLMAWA